MTRFDELANNGNIRRRAAGIAFLERGSNSARTTPPPGGRGGHNAYKPDTRKHKGLTRLTRLFVRFAESSLERSQINVRTLENKLL